MVEEGSGHGVPFCPASTKALRGRQGGRTRPAERPPPWPGEQGKLTCKGFRNHDQVVLLESGLTCPAKDDIAVITRFSNALEDIFASQVKAFLDGRSSENIVLFCTPPAHGLLDR